MAMVMLRKKKPVELNHNTPLWFKEWYYKHFMPVKIRQDLILMISGGVLVALIVKMFMG